MVEGVADIGYIMNKFLAPIGDSPAETTHEENQNDHIQEELPMEKIGEAIVRLPKGGSGKTVRLRSGPSKSANIRFEVPVGSVVSIFSQREGWWEIGYDGVIGWMMSSFLESSETMVSDKKAEIVTITLSKAAAEYLLEVLKGVL